MRIIFKRLVFILGITLMLQLNGYCTEPSAVMENFKGAMHDVLAHGKLTDIKYLSTKLGLELEIPATELNKSSEISAVITKSPDYFFASGLSYTVTTPDAGGKSRVTFTFPLRSCLSLQDWGEDWGRVVTMQLLTDAAGQEEELVWSLQDGISLTITQFTRGNCVGKLSQIAPRKGLLEAATSRARGSGDALAQSIADILKAGDLRDYRRTASALRTKLIPTGVRNGILYLGRVELANATPGINSSEFYYFTDDTGWASPPSFNAMPRHLADRIAILELSPDLHQICLPIENVTKELDRRSIRYRVANRQDTDEYTISLVGKNLITLGMRSSAGCTSRLHFEQITDIADNIGAPVVFPLDSSIDTNANALNDAAVAKLDAVVRHISAVRLGRIEIYQNLASRKSSQQKKAAQRLASLVRDSLVEKGISPTKIRIYGASTPVPNQLLSWEKRSAEAGIFIDAIATN